jgi:hypothetical protein
LGFRLWLLLLQVGKLTGKEAACKGDVLRAVTCTNFVFRGGQVLLGDLSSARRTIVVFGADGQLWPKVHAHGLPCCAEQNSTEPQQKQALPPRPWCSCICGARVKRLCLNGDVLQSWVCR